MKLPTFTARDLWLRFPLYDPFQWLDSDWSGTALDIANRTDIPTLYRLWILCCDFVLDQRTLRRFAVWCARRALDRCPASADRRKVFLQLCRAAERFAAGRLSESQFSPLIITAEHIAINADMPRDASARFAELAALASARKSAGEAAWVASRAACSSICWSNRVPMDIQSFISREIEENATQFKHLTEMISTSSKS